MGSAGVGGVHAGVADRLLPPNGKRLSSKPEKVLRDKLTPCRRILRPVCPLRTRFFDRLSLFAMIQNITKELGIKATATCLSSWPQTTFKGNPSSDNSFVLDPKAILNRLKCERISKLKKYEQEGSPECQEVFFEICRQIRVCLERCVEKYLFNGAVERYCSDIQTQRLRKLKFLTSSDFDFIDEYMTKYSPYVHAVADETPRQVPTASILEEDIEKILTWIEDIRNRMN